MEEFKDVLFFIKELFNLLFSLNIKGFSFSIGHLIVASYIIIIILSALLRVPSIDFKEKKEHNDD